MYNNSERITALDNKLSILNGRLQKMHEYLVEYPDSLHIKKEIEALSLTVEETQVLLNDEYNESN